MHMRGQDERRFKVHLTHLDRYRFSSQAMEDGRMHGAPYLSDEPDPVGDASAPSTPALLGSALGHCLSAALLEKLRDAGVKILGAEAETVVVVKPNCNGLRRIDRVEVTLKPRIPETSMATEHAGAEFSKHCTVTCSVRRGIDVRVNVDWQVEAAVA